MSENISYIGDSFKDPDNVARQAVGEFSSIIVIGRSVKDGEIEFKSSSLDSKELLWMLTIVQHKLMNGDYSV